MHYNRYSAPR